MSQDQVARLADFQGAHPDIRIDAPDYEHGGISWSAQRDGLILCVETELQVLLNHLDWLLSPPEDEGTARVTTFRRRQGTRR